MLKKIVFIVILLIVAGGIFLYKQTNQSWPWQKRVSLVSPTIMASPSPSVSATPQTNPQRELIMQDVAKTIGEISPVKPVLGGHWFVDRFWFVSGSDEDFYVEYEDGHILRRILVGIQNQESGVNYQVVAYFEPGESSWVLKSGQDTQFGKNLDLYEFNDSLKSWVKKN